MFLGSRPASGTRIGTATWPYNAHSAELECLTPAKSCSGKCGVPDATVRAEGFPVTSPYRSLTRFSANKKRKLVLWPVIDSYPRQSETYIAMTAAMQSSQGPISIGGCA
jgi:hypothetical protein